MGNKDTRPSFFEEDHSLQQTKPFCVLNLTQKKQSLAACHCSVAVHTSFTPISFLITGCPHVSPASQCPMHEVTTRQPCNLSSGCMTWFLLGLLFLFVLGFFLLLLSQSAFCCSPEMKRISCLPQHNICTFKDADVIFNTESRDECVCRKRT